MGFNQLGAAGIKFGSAGEVPSGKADDAPDRPESLRAQGDGRGLQDPRAKGRPLTIEGAGPAASAGIMGMKCRGFAPWLFPGHAFPVLDASPENLVRSVPFSFRFLAKIPGMALPARKFAS